MSDLEPTLAFALLRIDVPMPLVVTPYSPHLEDDDGGNDDGGNNDGGNKDDDNVGLDEKTAVPLQRKRQEVPTAMEAPAG